MKETFSRVGTAVVLMSFSVLIFYAGMLVERQRTSPGAASGDPSRAPPETPAPEANEESTPTLSATFVALNVDVYPTFNVIWDASLWASNVQGTPRLEDFEQDRADYGVVAFPYLTGRGFLLEGEVSAQVLGDTNLLDSGNVLHFRDFADGLMFHFPEGREVTAFGFDFKASERWLLQLDNHTVTIADGRRGFLGIEFLEGGARTFLLTSSERVQGGFTIDNIRYVEGPPP